MILIPITGLHLLALSTIAIRSFRVHLGVFAVKNIINQIGSNAANIVTVPIIPTTNISAHQKQLNISLIKWQLIVNKSADIVDIFRDVEFENHLWCHDWGLYILTCTSNSQKRWGVGILIRDSQSLNNKVLSPALWISSAYFQITGVNVRGTAVYQVHAIKKNGLISSETTWVNRNCIIS